MNRKTRGRRKFLQLTAAGIGAATALPSWPSLLTASPKDNRPNIVLIMADDMGFSDIGCYGGEIQTPNIDRLARNGLRFTQFYNCAKCAPTRASLLTGLYHDQTGVPPSRTERKNCITIAEALRQGGYTTMMVGKWHAPGVPRRRGFERFFGLRVEGPTNYFNGVKNCPFFLDDKPYQIPSSGFFMTDAFADYAVQFIGEAAKKDKPFFLYAAFLAPHWPLHAREADIRKYRELYSAGWDQIRKARFERLWQMRLIEPRWKLTPRDSRVPAWDKAGNKEWQAERMAVYAAQIDCLDRNVGRILAALKKAGVEENTLILFLSDNGPSAEGGPKGWWASRCTPSWRLDGGPVRFGNDPSIIPGSGDTFASYGIEWANVSNTPFRLYKGTNYEGSIATPLIACWPTAIKNRNSISHQSGHIIDIMATCLDVAAVGYPASFKGQKVLPLEGKSLLPIFGGKQRQGHEALYWKFGSRAVRMGKWKLVALKNKPWELYDMEADRTEMNNIASEEPQLVQQMAAMYDRWLRRCKIGPTGRDKTQDGG